MTDKLTREQIESVTEYFVRKTHNNDYMAHLLRKVREAALRELESGAQREIATEGSDRSLNAANQPSAEVQAHASLPAAAPDPAAVRDVNSTCSACSSTKHVQWCNWGKRFRSDTPEWVLLCVDCRTRYGEEGVNRALPVPPLAEDGEKLRELRLTFEELIAYVQQTDNLTLNPALNYMLSRLDGAINRLLPLVKT